MMNKINYNEIKTLQSIQIQKEKLNRKIKKQESNLLYDWEEVRNPFKSYVPVAKSAVKTLTLIPVLINSFVVGKKIVSFLFKHNEEK